MYLKKYIHDYLNFLLPREQLISPKLWAEMKKGDVTLTSTKLSQLTRWVHSLTSLFVMDFSSTISPSFFYTQNIWDDTNVCIYKTIFY